MVLNRSYSLYCFGYLLTKVNLCYSLTGSGILVNAAYPGIVNTSIKRHMGVDKSISGNIIAKPLLWLVPGTSKSPKEGSKTPLFLTLDNETINSANNSSGNLYDSKQEVLELDPVALDNLLAKKLFLVDEYWTGLKSKDSVK